MKNLCLALLLALTTSFIVQANARVPLLALERIDANTVLMSPEYTFQDQEMVDEPGRMTVKTPHKLDKAREMARVLLLTHNLDFNTNSQDNTDAFKGGYFLNMPGAEQWYVNSEPVCIEVNHTPRNIFGVDQVSPEIFAAAEQIGLVPYVNPAAERSGMGHIHVGGATLGDSPFFRFPNLLRNVMVYFHKHPSLLWGFGEAYDIGENSNIESLHTNGRQKKFEQAIAQHDAWWASASPSDKKKGLAKYLRFLKQNGGSDFFKHYRAINLQHVAHLSSAARLVPTLRGKLTVEFRGFRPPKSTDHLSSTLAMLLKLFDHLSDPNHLEPLPSIEKTTYTNFFSASMVASDWETVREQLQVDDGHLEEQIREYVDAVHRTEYRVTGLKGAQIFAAYSRKEDKGKIFEVLVPADSMHKNTEIHIHGQTLPTELISIRGVAYRTGVIVTNTPNPIATIDEIKGGNLRLYQATPDCSQSLQTPQPDS